jgi:hypothetical protein
MDAAVKGQPEISATPALEVLKPSDIPHLLLPGEMGAVLDWVVTDKGGEITSQGMKRSESFVRQFLELLWIQCSPIGEIVGYPVRDTSNTLRTLLLPTMYHWKVDAIAADITYGLVVGTDATAPTINDYKLGTIILHDAAPPTAGRMQYGAVAFGAPSADATTSQFTVTRNFANASGGLITVNEIGMYVIGARLTVLYYFMTIRDVIGGGIAVPNGQTLTINYRPQAVI